MCIVSLIERNRDGNQVAPLTREHPRRRYTPVDIPCDDQNTKGPNNFPQIWHAFPPGLCVWNWMLIPSQGLEGFRDTSITRPLWIMHSPLGVLTAVRLHEGRILTRALHALAFDLLTRLFGSLGTLRAAAPCHPFRSSAAPPHLRKRWWHRCAGMLVLRKVVRH